MVGMVTRNLNESLRHRLHPDEHERLQRRLQHRRLLGESDAASDREAAARLSGILERLERLRELLTNEELVYNGAGRMWWSQMPSEPPDTKLLL